MDQVGAVLSTLLSSMSQTGLSESSKTWIWDKICTVMLAEAQDKIVLLTHLDLCIPHIPRPVVMKHGSEIVNKLRENYGEIRNSNLVANKQVFMRTSCQLVHIGMDCDEDFTEFVSALFEDLPEREKNICLQALTTMVTHRPGQSDDTFSSIWQILMNPPASSIPEIGTVKNELVLIVALTKVNQPNDVQFNSLLDRIMVPNTWQKLSTERDDLFHAVKVYLQAVNHGEFANSWMDQINGEASRNDDVAEKTERERLKIRLDILQKIIEDNTLSGQIRETVMIKILNSLIILEKRKEEGSTWSGWWRSALIHVITRDKELAFAMARRSGTKYRQYLPYLFVA